MYIRSPKIEKEYSVKFGKFFNFLINNLGETEFKTNDMETNTIFFIKKPSLHCIFGNMKNLLAI
jgi:hypothetical protein